MSSSTSRLQLTKLADGENFSNSVLNANWDKVDNGYGTLNSQITTMFPVFTTVIYSQAIGASASENITVGASGGVYAVIITRVDRRKSGIYIVDSAGASAIVDGGATISLSGTTLTVANGNNYTVSATVYRIY